MRTRIVCIYTSRCSLSRSAYLNGVVFSYEFQLSKHILSNTQKPSKIHDYYILYDVKKLFLFSLSSWSTDQNSHWVLKLSIIRLKMNKIISSGQSYFNYVGLVMILFYGNMHKAWPLFKGKTTLDHLVGSGQHLINPVA